MNSSIEYKMKTQLKGYKIKLYKGIDGKCPHRN
jgi:hypothetical protein